MIVIAITPEMYESAMKYAVYLANLKRTPNSPPISGDDLRPDRDLTGILGDWAFAEWCWGDWRVGREKSRREAYGIGVKDRGRDLLGVDVKTTALSGRDPNALRLLVKEVQWKPGAIYVQAFYDEVAQEILLAGYMDGEELYDRCPEPIRRKADGYRNYEVRVPELRDMAELVHVGMIG